MKYACQYAIVRFMPFVETGEFANVGIVLMCPEAGYFNFQLLNRVRRITAFFDQLEARIYRDAKNDLKNELNRLKEQMSRVGLQNDRTARYIFQELVRPREVILRFDAPRVVLTDSPENKLDQLFRFYVERDFVTPDYIEKNIETKLRNILNAASLRDQYKEERIEHGAFHARFPFVHKDTTGKITKAMKALHLGHEDPAQAYEHGWAWYGKIKKLKTYDALPEQVMIATQGPNESNSEAKGVYQEIKNDFEAIGVLVAPLADSKKITEFAKIQ